MKAFRFFFVALLMLLGLGATVSASAQPYRHRRYYHRPYRPHPYRHHHRYYRHR